MNNFRKLLWLLPVGVTLHNIEEYVMFGKFLTKHPFPITPEQFLTAQITATIIIFLLYSMGWRKPKNNLLFFVILASIPAVIANSLMHIGQAIIFVDYTPGLISAVFLQLPIAIFLMRKAIIEKYIERNDFLKIISIGIILLVAVLLVSHAVGYIITTILPFFFD